MQGLVWIDRPHLSCDFVCLFLTCLEGLDWKCSALAAGLRQPPLPSGLGRGLSTLRAQRPAPRRGPLGGCSGSASKPRPGSGIPDFIHSSAAAPGGFRLAQRWEQG